MRSTDTERRSATGTRLMRSAENWPIGVAMFALAGSGSPSPDAGALPGWVHADLREVSDAGFRHIDLTDSWLSVGDLSASGREDLAAALETTRLAISAVSVTRRSILDPERAAENVDHSIRTIDAAAALGVPVVCLGLHRPLTAAQVDAQWFWHAPGAADPQDDDTWRRAVEIFRRLGEHAGELGVELSLEMYEDSLLGTSQSCVAMVEAIKLPNVGLNPDIANIVRLHRPVEHWADMLRAMVPYTNYWQVKNYLRDEDPATGAYFSAPAPLAHGYINYRHAIGLALEAGFDGPLCVEHYGGDSLSVAAENHDYLRRILRAKLARRP